MVMLTMAEEWNAELDDELKSALLSEEYKNFYQLKHEKPLLAGHASLKYFAKKFKRENVYHFTSPLKCIAT